MPDATSVWYRPAFLSSFEISVGHDDAYVPAEGDGGELRPHNSHRTARPLGSPSRNAHISSQRETQPAVGVLPHNWSRIVHRPCYYFDIPGIS